MKITSIEEEFKPITIKITFENEEEAFNFYSIFNHVSIIDTANFINQSRAIRDSIDVDIPASRQLDFVKRLKENINE